MLEKNNDRWEILLKGLSWGYKTSDKEEILSTGQDFKHEYLTKAYEDNIGRGTQVEITSTPSSRDLVMLFTITFYESDPSFLIELILVNRTPETRKIVEIYPCLASRSNGAGFFFSPNPSRCRILEAGLASMFDLNVRCVFGNEDSCSNGNVLIYDLDLARSICVGIIERPSGMVQILTNEEEDEGIKDKVSERISFGDWKIQKGIVPCKVIHPGNVFSSNKVYFDSNPGLNEFEKLERYATRLATVLGVKPWPRDRCIPHGWNSWGNPAKTDPHDETGQNINVLVHDLTESNVLENFKAAHDNLAKFGLEYFQIDDGYEKAVGDWAPIPSRFPNGLKPVFDTIRGKGIKAGMWIRPFEISTRSQLYKVHPDWGLDWESSFPMKSKASLPLDVSNPAVQKWMRVLFSRIKHYYGLNWIKTDFTYNLLGGKGFYDKDLTAVEAMQLGFQIIRDVIGDETFMVGIGGPCQLHYGLVDAERLTLDVQPAWGKDGMMMPEKQGIKPNARIIARRYYLHNRVWFTHCDVLQFREPLTRSMYLIQATVMGLSGGVFKVGEKFTNLTKEHFDVVSKILPIYRPFGRGMRPIDLFYKEYPEIWDLLIDDYNNGLGKYHVVGLFNWGENKDLDKTMPSEPRDIRFYFQDLGLEPEKYVIFEFWEEKFKGEHMGYYESKIEPRNLELLVIREMRDHPMFLSSSRHVTQGSIDIQSVEWDKNNFNLIIRAKGVPEYEHHFHFYIPDNYEIVSSMVNDTDVKLNEDNRPHAILSYYNADGSDLLIELGFIVSN